MAFCAKKDPSLYPNAMAKDLEKFYDSKLGPHTRRCAYFLVFQDAQATKKLMADPIDGLVLRSVTKVLYPVLSLLVTRGMNINEKAAERSWSRIENILEGVEEKLGSGPIGSRFLAGDSFSAADIAFCSHVALLVLPPELEYISPHFSLDTIKHPVFRDRLEKLQHSKTGQFVLQAQANVAIS